MDHLWAGINKDTSSSPFYIEAVAIAKLATVDYLDQLFDKIGADAFIDTMVKAQADYWKTQ